MSKEEGLQPASRNCQDSNDINSSDNINSETGEDNSVENRSLKTSGSDVPNSSLEKTFEKVSPSGTVDDVNSAGNMKEEADKKEYSSSEAAQKVNTKEMS